MSYILRKVDAEARERISRDATDRQRFVLENVAFFESHPSLQWAVDDRSGCYLVLAPRTTPEDGMDDIYYFGFAGRLIEFRIPAFGNGVKFHPQAAMDIQHIERIQHEIVAAFRSHGREGRGARDLQPTPFVPVFE